jgi:hypothetical protein
MAEKKQVTIRVGRITKCSENWLQFTPWHISTVFIVAEEELKPGKRFLRTSRAGCVFGSVDRIRKLVATKQSGNPGNIISGYRLIIPGFPANSLSLLLAFSREGFSLIEGFKAMKL